MSDERLQWQHDWWQYLYEYDSDYDTQDVRDQIEREEVEGFSVIHI